MRGLRGQDETGQQRKKRMDFFSNESSSYMKRDINFGLWTARLMNYTNYGTNRP